jgi:chemotaxis family two-component system response regulator Rcp1
MSERDLVRSIEILLVEDNPGDADLAAEALANCKMYNRLNTVNDGEKAMAYLRHQGPYCDARLPDLILLDLNLPRMDGREVLAEIKRDGNLKRIPVVILTTSRADEDVLRSYDLHANCYIAKPIDLTQFMHVVAAIESFWLSIVVLPPQRQSA